MREEWIRKSSAWDADTIEDFLSTSRIPVRLATLSAPGQPLLCSLWFDWDDDALWCATVRTALLVKKLVAHPNCAFEVAGDQMPYRGVRGQGRATIIAGQGAAVLSRLIDRYLETRDSKFAQWLLSRADQEVAIRIEPDWLTSWDFSARMNK